MAEQVAPPPPMLAAVAALARDLALPTPTLVLVDRPGAPVGWAEVNRRTHTIWLSTAAAEMPDGALRAVLAHEMAHLRKLRREIVVFLLVTVMLAAFLIVIIINPTLLLPVEAYLMVDAVFVPWLLTNQWMRRRNELAADRTAAHHTGAEGAAAFEGPAGWADWPASTALRWAVRPWRAHPWPPLRVRTYRAHAWRRCGCPPGLRRVAS